ncbi:hypothetical protein PAJ34TS1_49740 [Paenibacillus azoreducens]
MHIYVRMKRKRTGKSKKVGAMPHMVDLCHATPHRALGAGRINEAQNFNGHSGRYRGQFRAF